MPDEHLSRTLRAGLLPSHAARAGLGTATLPAAIAAPYGLRVRATTGPEGTRWSY